MQMRMRMRAHLRCGWQVAARLAARRRDCCHSEHAVQVHLPLRHHNAVLCAPACASAGTVRVDAGACACASGRQRSTRPPLASADQRHTHTHTHTHAQARAHRTPTHADL
jgi:hypothetical protein